MGRVFASVRQAIITATWAQCVGDLMALPALPGMVQMSLRTDALHKVFHIPCSPTVYPFVPTPSINYPSLNPLQNHSLHRLHTTLAPSPDHPHYTRPLVIYKSCYPSLEESKPKQQTRNIQIISARAGLKRLISFTHSNLVSHSDYSRAGRRKVQRHLYNNNSLSTTYSTTDNTLVTARRVHLFHQPNSTFTRHHHQQPPHRSNGRHTREPRRLRRVLQRPT